MNSRLHSIVHSSWFSRLMISIIPLAGLLAGLETNAPAMNHYGALLRGLDVSCSPFSSRNHS